MSSLQFRLTKDAHSTNGLDHKEGHYKDGAGKKSTEKRVPRIKNAPSPSWELVKVTPSQDAPSLPAFIEKDFHILWAHGWTP